jgi:hypothetical protein
MNRRSGNLVTLWCALSLGAASAACTSVDAVRLTNETFPPKASPQEVEILDQIPKCPHIALAELSIDDSSLNFGEIQDKIIKKAVKLGADAVVFAKPEKRGSAPGRLSSPMMYSPWGYGASSYGYGMGCGAYGAGMVAPYDVTVKSLKGLAIHYQETTGPKC